jgi:rubrerythrin
MIMVDFDKSQTKTNLAKLFAAECQDGARYQFLAQQADTDKYSYLKGVMKLLATNEMAHAKVFYDLMVKHAGESRSAVGFTADFPFPSYQLQPGLEKAAKAELLLAQSVYPAFAKTAKAEGYADVEKAILLAAEVENTHNKLLSGLAEKLKSKKLYKSKEATMWSCGNCGHQNKSKEAWTVCPLCNHDQGYVKIPSGQQN